MSRAASKLLAPKAKDSDLSAGHEGGPDQIDAVPYFGIVPTVDAIDDGGGMGSPGAPTAPTKFGE